MITLLAAMDRNRVIGRDGQMPWRLPADMRHFRRTTLGHVVVMGRRTYQSIGRPLEGRTNIVLTRDKNFQAPGCEVRHAGEEVLADPRPLYVIGGAELYRQFLPHADEMILTRIYHEFPGDTFFPAWDPTEWELVKARAYRRDEGNPYDFVIERYRRATHQGSPVRAD